MKKIQRQRQMNVQELELPSIMASLDICEENEVDNPLTPSLEHQRNLYILRKRQIPAHDVIRKRRCQLKPTKLNISLPSDNLDYYINSSICRPARYLETIYEEPVAIKNGCVKHMGCGKQRKVQFNGITKSKIKHRKSKLKKINSCRTRIKRKINMDEFIARFHEVMETKEEEQPVSNTDTPVATMPSVS